jgi:hypothetical protein
VISVKFQGQLGNQMFQYATVKAIAKKLGYLYHIQQNVPPGIHRVFPNIDLGTSDWIQKHHYIDEQNQKYNPKLFEIEDYTLIEGFFQTHKYFHHIKDEIVQDFLFANDVVDPHENDGCCLIHVRGSDYCYGWALPQQYYLNAIEEMKKRGVSQFKIVTDDIGLAGSYLPGIEILTDPEATTSISGLTKDLYRMTKAENLIIANSTFSWWGAYLSKAQNVIAPDNWINYNRPEEDWFPYDIKNDFWSFIR